MSLFTAKCGRCDTPLTRQDYDLCGKRTPHCKNCHNRIERHRLTWGKRVRVKYEPSGKGATIKCRWPGPPMKHVPAYQRLVAASRARGLRTRQPSGLGLRMLYRNHPMVKRGKTA